MHLYILFPPENLKPLCVTEGSGLRAAVRSTSAFILRPASPSVPHACPARVLEREGNKTPGDQPWVSLPNWANNALSNPELIYVVGLPYESIIDVGCFDIPTLLGGRGKMHLRSLYGHVIIDLLK